MSRTTPQGEPTPSAWATSSRLSLARPVKPEFPISTLSLRENHTPAALSCQFQIDIAALGSHRGSFGSFADLFCLFLASNLPGRSHLSRLDHFGALDSLSLLIRYPSGFGSAAVLLCM